MDTTNSQKKSPRNLVTNERTNVDATQPEPPATRVDESEYETLTDRSTDLVARVRAAKEAAQRKMEEFGDPSEYEITTFRGHGPKKIPSEPAQNSAKPQPSFPFVTVPFATEDANSQRKSPRSSVKNERTDIDQGVIPGATDPTGSEAE